MERRVVTPEQLEQGYMEFRTDEIANRIRRDFVVLEKLADGNYVVQEPKAAEPSEIKPTIPDILPLLREYHAGTHPNGGWNGGHLHIVLIDGNVKDEDVHFLSTAARKKMTRSANDLLNFCSPCRKLSDSRLAIYSGASSR